MTMNAPSNSMDGMLQEYALAKRRMTDVEMEMKNVDMQMHTVLEKIQNIHRQSEEGNRVVEMDGPDEELKKKKINAAKSVGMLEVHVVEGKGFVDVDGRIEVRMTVKPEDAYEEEGEENITKKTAALIPMDGMEHVEWNEIFTFDPILSREAIVTLSMVKLPVEMDTVDETVLNEVSIPVSKLFTQAVDEWYPLQGAPYESDKDLEEFNVEQTEEQAPGEAETEVSPTKAPNSTETAETESAAQGKAENGHAAESTEEESSRKMSRSMVVPQVTGNVLEETKETNMALVRIKTSFSLSDVEKLSHQVLMLSQRRTKLESELKGVEASVKTHKVKLQQMQGSARGATTKKEMSVRQQQLRAAWRRNEPGVENMNYWQRTKRRFRKLCIRQNVTLARNVLIFASSVLIFHFGGENFAV